MIVILPGLLLLGWSVVATIRMPRRAWPTVPLLVGFCTVLWFGGEPLMLAGGRAYFAVRQATYERIIMDVRTGRLAPEGRSHGVTYRVSTGPYPEAIFQWGSVSWGFFGILYDEYTCNDRTPPQPPEPPEPRPDGVDPPTIKNGRHLNGYYRPLSNKACLTYVVG